MSKKRTGKLHRVIRRHKLMTGIIMADIIILIIVLTVSACERDRHLRLISQQAAARWQGGDTSYAQVSVFYPEDGGVGLSEIKGIENSINSQLYEDSNMTAAGRTWIDAYSYKTSLDIRFDTTTVTATTYCVGGDYFQFHNIKLYSGNYFDPEDTDYFKVILDTDMAWTLFGSKNVQGMKCWIGDYIFTVEGVVDSSTSDMEQQAYGNYNAIYIPIGAIGKMGVSEDTDISENIKATCYEVVLPNPIQNYGYNVVAEACGITVQSDEEKQESKSSLSFGGAEIVENSSRFDILKLYKSAMSRKYQDMITSGITYPFWENVARYETHRSERILIFLTVLMILPIATACYIVYLLWKYKSVPFRILWSKLMDKREQRLVQSYERRLQEKRPEEHPEEA